MARAPQLLIEFLRDSAATPFRWGRCDCALWVAQWVKLNTGADFGALFTHHDEASAAEAVQAYGDLRGLVTHFLGPPKTAPPTPGDVAVTIEPQTLGIVYGAAIMLKGARHAVPVPLQCGAAFWSLD